MKKAFGAILIAVILIVCVVTLTVQRGENAMLEFPERPAEGCTVMSLEITDGKAQTEVIGTYNVNENVLTMNTSALENAEPTESGENYTYTLPESIPNFYFSDTTQGLLLYKGYLYVVTATTSGQTLEIINLKTGSLGGAVPFHEKDEPDDVRFASHERHKRDRQRHRHFRFESGRCRRCSADSPFPRGGRHCHDSACVQREA